ncbi:dihydrofolate reductase family protein [Aquihabitans sp. G128]|uniref:dihydrofolate reductase family protein n=1 Tax=Aquihabitans sp. G128 TaxID=2849779 RepID=UPI001C2243A6|nr:dihydrofolate reductase family protein [Aquihabitans sp. G128]QXC59669.1 dihydrofolate reductase family protein [Aquihabitans sp. G128]
MATITISTNSSLDGVVQDPDGTEGFDRGGWFPPPGSLERVAWAEHGEAEAHAAGALLLGRSTYEWFASRWANRDGAWADRLNGLQKFVVSSQLDAADATWGPTTALRGDVAEQVARLKEEQEGELVVYASYRLGQLLLEHDLVDEVRVFVFPVVLGAGRRLFGETSARKPLRLRKATTVGGGLALLTYEAATSA